jgi:hypothetical protein
LDEDDEDSLSYDVTWTPFLEGNDSDGEEEYEDEGKELRRDANQVQGL